MGEVAGGGRWEAEGGLYHHWYRDRAVVSSMKHRDVHIVATCQAKIAVGNSLTPHATLLVLPSGTTYPVVDLHEFTRPE